MMGHQRDIMAALGIDIWIPKDALCQQHQPAIWRDQAPEEAISEIILPHMPAVAEQPERPQPPVHQEPVLSAPEAEQQQTAPAAVQEALVSAMHIPAFSIEAMVLPQCVLLVDATAITADQQQLWRNIQRAVSAEFHHLQWPFAWQNMQDGRGASSYIQGFLDVFSTEKNVLCLGEIPHLQASHSIQLASLQEMMSQPLLKKRLWQFMQNKMKES